jgi:hypothetical protein
MLAIPDETFHRATVADWVELKAVASLDGRIGFGTLISAMALTENEQDKIIDAENTREEQLVEMAQNEIIRRRRAIGDDYPFRIDDKGHALHLTDPVTTVGSVYLFCLFLSHSFSSVIVPKELAPEVTNAIRDLFQACATVAAGGFVEGPAISFGWPRPEGEGFLTALHRVYRKFGDGRPHATPRPAAPARVKDNGIDVIAWKRTRDTLPGTLYLVAQVASGADWKYKSVKADRKHFHDYWFTDKPASQPHDAMFMPFELEPEDPKNGTPYEEVLKDYMSSEGYRFGKLFYRDRIVEHVAKGLQLIAEGEADIERHEDLALVIRWVDEYRARLRAA